jgi:hypothetical protein
MQHEFNNRIAAQRSILQLVNSKGWPEEELFGLSSKAIDRWVATNRLEPKSKLIGLVKGASGKLFFLANKSQEQISPEYQAASSEIAAIYDAIRAEMDRNTV